MARTKQVELFGKSILVDTRTMSAQRRVNCYLNFRPDGDKTKFSIIGTPGKTLFVNAPAYPIRGGYVPPGGSVCYVAALNQLVSINGAGIVTTIGTINSNTNPVEMIDNGTQLLVLDGTHGYIVVMSTGVMTQIADSNFPQTATSCAFQDTYFFVNDPSGVGAWRQSAANDGTTWPALQQGIAQSNPDPLVWVAALHGLMLFFGTNSIEWWQDLGITPGVTYAPIVAATQDFGLYAKYSISYFSDSYAFLGKSIDGRISVFMMEGFRPVRISNDDLDSIIVRMAVNTDAVGVTYAADGHLFYEIIFPSANRSFIYDANTKIWSETQTGIGPSAGRSQISCGFGFQGKSYVGSSNGSQIWQIDPTNFTEGGNPIQRILQTRHVFDDENMLGLSDLTLNMETGVGLQTGQGSNPQIMLSISKDGGRTFGNERWTSIGAVGQYSGPRATWRRLGAGRDFVFQWKMTDPVKFAINNGVVSPMQGLG